MYAKIRSCFYTLITLILSFTLLLVGYCWYCRMVKGIDFPSVFGYSIARVASGSMQPELNIGDIVIIRECDDYYVGDIITYNNSGAYVTHRIVDMKADGDQYITKGDFNNTEDELPVSRDTIQGKVVNHIGGVWDFITYTRTPKGLALCIAAIFMLTFLPFLVKSIISKLKKGSYALSYSKGYSVFHAFIFVSYLAMVIISGAKITGVCRANDAATAASFTLGIDDSEAVGLSMQNLKPGDQKYFQFSVKNKNDDVTSQVAQDYTIFIRLVPKDANNIRLPLEFSIEKSGTQTNVPGVFVDEDDILIDSSTNIGHTSTGKIPASSSTISHNYKINVNWPSTEKNYSYAGQENEFEIFVRSKQLDKYSGN